MKKQNWIYLRPKEKNGYITFTDIIKERSSSLMSDRIFWLTMFKKKPLKFAHFSKNFDPEST